MAIIAKALEADELVIVRRALKRELDTMRANGVSEEDDELNCVYDLVLMVDGNPGEGN